MPWVVMKNTSRSARLFNVAAWLSIIWAIYNTIKNQPNITPVILPFYK